MQHRNTAGSTCATHRQCNAARSTQAMNGHCSTASTHATVSAALQEATRIHRSAALLALRPRTTAARDTGCSTDACALQAVRELCTQYGPCTGRGTPSARHPVPPGAAGVKVADHVVSVGHGGGAAK